ncbi:MAG TPA: ABC transporter ATP-binding protein [Egibacteraceae bacterium]|nr:ABC transporter ATP-binding protein [Egibacteraceae bacterium]
MITFEAVTKRFPDGTLAVEDLDLAIPEGEIVVLVGPSGCGKTTTMRLVNRMAEPTAGRVLLAGTDVRDVPAHELRRGIGYVIQQIGLFPHRSAAQNIATVPELAGWPRDRVRARVDELMALVGLPAETAGRFPHQLSGGQRQRVGVARALAADPPVLLMDEPFGAVDPVVRGQLQDELLRLQQAVHKTIVFVTHDIDEALKLGDRIAVMSAPGRVRQYDTPSAILARPADDFVTEFLGAERGLKRLALIPVSQVKADPGPAVPDGAPRADAVRAAEAAGTDWVVVLGPEQRLLGWVWVADVAERVDGSAAREFWLRVRAEDSLRAALDAMLSTRTGVAVRISGEDRYEGVLTRELLTEEIV